MKPALAVLIVLLFLPAITFAQDGDCSAVVEKTLADVMSRCGGVAPGQVCFGNPEIDFTANRDDVVFAVPGDILALDAACCLRLGALQPPDRWGVAVMNVQPDGATHNLIYVLFGDVEIHNAASFFSELEARIDSDTNVYTGPGSHYDILATVAAGDVVYVNACNCTQNWLRVRLANGAIGWMPARRATVLGEVDSLPVAAHDTPVYAAMQAFTFRSGSQSPACPSAPESGILIQAPPDAGEIPLWINGVEVTVSSTLFIQAEPEGDFTIEVLDGSAVVAANDKAMTVPAGVRASIPLSGGYQPGGPLRIEPYAATDVAHLPLGLLPEPIDALAALDNEVPRIVGQEACRVVSDRGPTACRLHFVNLDGDPIVRMVTEFVYAAQGQWEGSVRESPQILEGDSVAGVLEWKASCSLGGANFIGPVVWSITLTDASGHVSAPFEASFNCVDG